MTIAYPSALRRLQQNQFFTGGLTIAVLLLVAIIWFFFVHAVRIKELRYRLKSTTDQNASVRTISLVSRYKLLRQSTTTDSASYLREGRTMQLLSQTALLAAADDLTYGETTAKFSVDFFDWLTGTPAFRYKTDTREGLLAERAFYHEITRNYAEAVSAYNTALPNTNGAMQSYLLLHRAFCRALVSDRKNAIADFRTVIESKADNEHVETAQILLEMISGVDAQIERIDALPASKQKATAYYELTAYDQAIGNFKKLESTQSDPEALFYLGRSLEETGRTSEAADAYRKSIKVGAGTIWAQKSNRRLFALGAFYAAGKEFRQESTSNVEKGIVKDNELIKQAENFQKVSEHIEEGEKRTLAKILSAPEKVKSTYTGEALKVFEQTSESVIQKTEKINVAEGPDWANLENLSRTGKIGYIGKQKRSERITLDNGNQFKGLLISENKDTVILFTSLGRVVIYKSQIDSREVVGP